MSYQAVAWAYKQDINPSGAKFILVTIANYADGDGHCYPGQGRLAEDTSMNERHVRRCLNTLEDAGLLYRQHRYDRNGKRTSDEFWLIGFKPLPDDIAASLPDTMSASDQVLPDISDTTTGHYVRDYRTIEPVPIRNLNSQSEQSEEKSVKKAPTKSARERDELFEVIAECWLGVPYPALKLTKSQRGNINSCASQLRQVDADPSDIPRQWELLRERFDNPTPAALAKHWNTNGTGPKRKESKNDTTRNAVREFIAGNSESSGSDHRNRIDAHGYGPES